MCHVFHVVDYVPRVSCCTLCATCFMLYIMCHVFHVVPYMPCFMLYIMCHVFLVRYNFVSSLFTLLLSCFLLHIFRTISNMCRWDMLINNLSNYVLRQPYYVTVWKLQKNYNAECNLFRSTQFKQRAFAGASTQSFDLFIKLWSNFRVLARYNLSTQALGGGGSRGWRVPPVGNFDKLSRFSTQFFFLCRSYHRRDSK